MDLAILMSVRIIYAVSAAAALLAMLISMPSWRPHLAWLVYLLGALAFAAAVLRPRLVPGRWPPILTGLGSLVGVAAGSLIAHTDVAGMYIVRQQLGYPFPWIARHAVYDHVTPSLPPSSFDTDAHWGSPSAVHLGLNALYFACAVMAFIVLIRVVIQTADKAITPPTTAKPTSPASGG